MRSPRRSFAAPFVITLAGACSSSPPPEPQEPPRNPPPPEVGTTEPTPTQQPPVIVANPPRPQVEKTDRRWTAFQRGKECFAGIRVECPKAEPGKPVPTCNPPPPVKYDCQGLSFTRPIEIVRRAGEVDCFTVPEMPPCPAGAACNPPPPQKVICPSR